MRTLLVSILTLTVMSSPALAQAPDSLGFQGFVTTPGGDPINNAGIAITFKLYEGTTKIWSETQPTVAITGGVFNVLLGSVTPLDSVRFNRPLSLGIKVGADPEISPPTPLAAAAYAKALPGLYTFYHNNGGSKSYNVIGGASNNVVGPNVAGATIGGGGGFSLGPDIPFQNSVLSDFGTVGGGDRNTVSAKSATVGGGSQNTASGTRATVGGGYYNEAKGIYATVPGGTDNTASVSYSTVGGGRQNTAKGNYSTVGGGAVNEARGDYATVGGGYHNEARGDYATVPGGVENMARGYASFAAGHDARAIHDGTFVWNDRSVTTGNDSLLSTGANQFLIRAAGGVGVGTNQPGADLHIATNSSTSKPQVLLQEKSTSDFARLRLKNDSNVEYWDVAAGGTNNEVLNFYSNQGRNNVMSLNATGTPVVMYNGATLTHAGVWTSVSSLNRKTNFVEINPRTVLEGLAALPVRQWRYKVESENVIHIGPTAEEFHEMFGLGESTETIGTVDADGVALAAIQGLYELVQELQAEVKALKAERR